MLRLGTLVPEFREYLRPGDTFVVLGVDVTKHPRPTYKVAMVGPDSEMLQVNLATPLLEMSCVKVGVDSE